MVQLYLSCHCQEEIAGKVGMTHKGVGRVLEQMEGFRFVPKLGHHSEIKEDNVRMDLIASENCENAEHTTDFAPPIYNIWKQQTKTSGSSHFGNSEVRWLDSLLYLYTQPFDIILDPFAGGGSTIDLCKKRMRRYFVSDRLPIVEREHEIRQHDLIVDGKVALPKPPQWQDVKLVYLDPPYWKQAEGKYSQDPTDLANMDLDDFTRLLAGIITGYAKKLTDAYIALIIQPTQWKAPNRDFVDHIGDMLKAIKLPVDMRYSVPYESQQCTPQMVDWSKDNKRCLVLTREIVVWRV